MNNAAKAITDYESTTECEHFYTSFKWYLKEWSVMTMEHNHGIHSEDFVINGSEGESNLGFYPKSKWQETTGNRAYYIRSYGVYFTVCWPKKFSFSKLQFSFSFVDKKMKKLHTCQSELDCYPANGQTEIQMCESVKFWEGTPFILDDTLIILFEIEIVRTVTLPPTIVDSYHGSSNIVYDGNDLYNDTDFSDIKFFFKETGRTLTAHKHVLAARSPVFRAMFTTDMKELQSGQVTIEDFDDTVFEKFLRYVYTGKIDAFEDVASELMATASKYQVLSLIDHCERFMAAQMDDKNALNYLITARRYSATNLEKRAIAYIKKNTKILAQAAADDSFSESLPAVIRLIFSEYVRDKYEAECPVKKARV